MPVFTPVIAQTGEEKNLSPILITIKKHFDKAISKTSPCSQTHRGKLQGL